MSDVIYFVDPIEENINHIVNDFPPDDKDEFDFDQYGAVHICLTSSFTSD